jgi:hypothetical protein
MILCYICMGSHLASRMKLEWTHVHPCLTFPGCEYEVANDLQVQFVKGSEGSDIYIIQL